MLGCSRSAYFNTTACFLLLCEHTQAHTYATSSQQKKETHEYMAIDVVVVVVAICIYSHTYSHGHNGFRVCAVHVCMCLSLLRAPGSLYLLTVVRRFFVVWFHSLLLHTPGDLGFGVYNRSCFLVSYRFSDFFSSAINEIGESATKNSFIQLEN